MAKSIAAKTMTYIGLGIGIPLCFSSCTSRDAVEPLAAVAQADKKNQTQVAIDKLQAICSDSLKGFIISPSFKTSKAPTIDTVDQIVADIRKGFVGKSPELYDGIYDLTEGITSAFEMGFHLQEYFSDQNKVKLNRTFKTTTVESLYKGVCIDSLQTITTFINAPAPVIEALPAMRMKPSFKIDYKQVEGVSNKCKAINEAGAFASNFSRVYSTLSEKDTQQLGIIYSAAEKAVRSDDPDTAVLGVALGRQAHTFLSYHFQLAQYLVDHQKMKLPTRELQRDVGSVVYSRCRDNLQQSVALLKEEPQTKLPEVAVKVNGSKQKTRIPAQTKIEERLNRNSQPSVEKNENVKIGQSQEYPAQTL